MTERKRLIGLLIKAHVTFGTCTIADYLLANGVFVPPVRVGDTVYVISRGEIVSMEVDTIQINRNGYNILGRNERYWGNGTITLHPNYGAEWYITREAAENALKEKTNEKASNV